MALLAQYKGAGKINKRYNTARQELEVIHYKGNEATFPFSRYAAKLQDIYIQMRDAGRPCPEWEKVEELLGKMQVESSHVLTTIKTLARDKHPDDFTLCATYISNAISTNMKAPSQNARPGTRARLISEVNSGHGRGSRTRGRYNNRSGNSQSGSRTDDSSVLIFGVNMTDPNRCFTEQEMCRLGSEGQAMMFNMRRSMGGDNNSTGGRGRHTGRSINATQSGGRSTVSEITDANTTGNNQGQNQLQTESNHGASNSRRFGRRH